MRGQQLDQPEPGDVADDQGDEGQRHRHRDRGLEDHRTRDVAHRQGVLALADPQDAVELLRQLGRDRGDHEREQPEVSSLMALRGPAQTGPEAKPPRCNRRPATQTRTKA